MSGRYVYALTATAVPSFTIGASKVESVEIDGIFAVSETVSQPPAVSEEALRHQHAVVSRVAARAEAVLPARFGSFVELDELRRLVQLRRVVIRAALDLVRGREQMTVRIMGDRPESAQSAIPETGTEYLNQRRARLSGEGLPGVETVQRAVKGLAAAERVEPGPAFVTVYHLITAGSNDSYRAHIAEAASELAPLVARVTGPWPPFAFVPELMA